MISVQLVDLSSSKNGCVLRAHLMAKTDWRYIGYGAGLTGLFLWRRRDVY